MITIGLIHQSFTDKKVPRHRLQGIQYQGIVNAPCLNVFLDHIRPLALVLDRLFYHAGISIKTFCRRQADCRSTQKNILIFQQNMEY